MYTIKVIQGPKTLFFDEKNGREMESIISINGDTEIKGIEIWLNAEESSKGSNISFKNESNKEFKLKDSWDISSYDIEIEQDIFDILEKLANATLYDELGTDGSEFSSEEVLEWEF